MNPKNYKAAVYPHSSSAMFQAVFYAFDAKQERWVRKWKSTGTSNKRKAVGIAEEYQAFALKAAGGAGEFSLTREAVLETLNQILRLAGRETVVETRKWDEYSQAWLELRRSGLSVRSLESYEGNVRVFTRWLGEAGQGTALNAITGDLMQTWYGDMLDEGRRCATVNNMVKTLQAVFDRARAEGLCPRNPAELILRQYGERLVREPYTLADIQAVLACLRKAAGQGVEDAADWLTVVLLGLCTGQRLQDCALANWSDFEKVTATGKGKAGFWVWNLRQGKTGRKKGVIRVPVAPQLDLHLEGLWKRRAGLLLAPGLAGLPSGGNGGLSDRFSGWLERSGIERVRTEALGDSGRSFTNKTFHSFRHTANSMLANEGVSMDVRRAILGHASAEMNLRYTHLEVEKMQAEIERAILFKNG